MPQLLHHHALKVSELQRGASGLSVRLFGFLSQCRCRIEQHMLQADSNHRNLQSTELNCLERSF